MSAALTEKCTQLLGAMLSEADGDKIIEQAVRAGCSEAWWAEAWQREAWAHLMGLYAAGKPTNYMEVLVRIHENAGGQLTSRHIEECIARAVMMHNAEGHLEYLRCADLLARGRRAVLLAGDAIESATPDTSAQAIAAAQQAIMSVEFDGGMDDAHPADVAVKLIETWRTTTIEERKGVHWFLPKLDALIGPLEDELVFIASRRSVGKTAFSLNMMVCSAWAGNRLSFASLESPRAKVAQRLTSIVTQHNANAMKFRAVPDERYTTSAEKMRAFKLKPSGWTFTARTPEQLTAWARMEKKRGSMAIIIDNMKHVQFHAQGKSTTEHFRELSLRLKELRDGLGIPVIVLHHLNDDGDVSWSRDIENDADIIAKLVNENDDLAEEIKRVRFVVSKNRDGRTGQVVLSFDKSTQTFTAAEGD